MIASPAVEGTISSLIAAVDGGDRSALSALYGALYAELHRLAQKELARIGGKGGLGATTLLHEAYLDLSARGGASFLDRARFMGYASRVMRGVIIDHARNRRAQKRGGRFEITSLETDAAQGAVDDRELVQINDALNELAEVDPSLAELVDLKFFCGLSFAEIASLRGSSERTVQRNWEKARLYLHRALQSEDLVK